eukprot:UN04780
MAEVQRDGAIADSLPVRSVEKRKLNFEPSQEKKRQRIDLKPETKFRVGQAVWCLYMDEVLGPKHYEATISRVHSDGRGANSYDVEWKDNDAHNKLGHPEKRY